MNALCPTCRRDEVAHARAAIAVLSDATITQAEREVAADELTRAAGWLRLPGAPHERRGVTGPHER